MGRKWSPVQIRPSRPKIGKANVEKVWLKSYPEGIPAEINPDTYQSIPEMFEQSCAQYGDAPAFYSMGVSISFRQLELLTRAFSAYFQTVLKLKKGDRIAIMLPNILQYPVIMYAALRAGLIVVNVNPLYTPPELVHQLTDAGAETLIVLSNFAGTVHKALPETPLKNIIITNLGDLFPFFKATVINFVLKYIKKQIPSCSIPNVIQFKNALKQGQKLTFNPVVITNQDIAFLQYTGGTTGVAKAAMLTHRNLIANILQAEAWFSPIFKKNQEVIITALPLYHIFSLTANCLFISKIGGFNILIANPRDILSIVKEMKKFKFTVITGVNTLFNALLRTGEFVGLDFSSLKLSLGGGMAVQQAVAEKWQVITGKFILEAYGLTETSPCVAINPVILKHYNGTVGLPVSSTNVCILDDNQQEVPIGQPGELAIKGPQVMNGYWRNPIETQKVFTSNGWLLTGDIASIDEKGFVRILERKKDMILVSGFNVYPNEIEDVLVRLKGVKEAAVIGVKDENSGEAVKAFIVKDDPSLTTDDVLTYCRDNLTGYKLPKYIEFYADLPKSNVGKILRRELKNIPSKILS